MPHPIFVALYLLGIVPVYSLVRNDDPLPRWQAIPLALLWPVVVYVGLIVTAISEAVNRREAKRP